MKKVAIIQSNYIPWKGYFDMIAAVSEILKNVAGASAVRLPRNIVASAPRIKRDILNEAD